MPHTDAHDGSENSLDEWRGKPVTKSDLYYVTYSLLSCTLLVSSTVLVSLGDLPTGILFVIGGVVALSLGLASKYDGMNLTVWKKIKSVIS